MRVLAVFLLAALLVPLRGAAQTPPTDTLKVLLNPTIIFEVPLMVAIDKGYFAQQNLNVQVVIHAGSSQVIIPELARGDVDIATISPNPGFFNQFSQGFDAKLIAATVAGHKGWNPAVWLVERQATWDAKTIRAPRDLRGKRIDAATPGSEGWYLVRNLLTNAALTPADMAFTERFSTPPDWLVSMRNNVDDVQAAYEPTVTQIEQQHLGHRWLSITDIDPLYQESFLAASARTLKSRPDVIRRFLTAFVKAQKLILDGHGKWTPDVVAIFAKYSGLPPDVIEAIPSPPYTGEFGTIHALELEKIQRFWHTYGLVPAEQPIEALADPSFITAAQKAAGVASR